MERNPKKQEIFDPAAGCTDGDSISNPKYQEFLVKTLGIKRDDALGVYEFAGIAFPTLNKALIEADIIYRGGNKLETEPGDSISSDNEGEPGCFASIVATVLVIGLFFVLIFSDFIFNSQEGNQTTSENSRRNITNYGPKNSETPRTSIVHPRKQTPVTLAQFVGLTPKNRDDNALAGRIVNDTAEFSKFGDFVTTIKGERYTFDLQDFDPKAQGLFPGDVVSFTARVEKRGFMETDRNLTSIGIVNFITKVSKIECEDCSGRKGFFYNYCIDCRGTGETNIALYKKCPSCLGSGKGNYEPIWMKCPHCDGVGSFPRPGE